VQEQEAVGVAAGEAAGVAAGQAAEEAAEDAAEDAAGEAAGEAADGDSDAEAELVLEALCRSSSEPAGEHFEVEIAVGVLQGVRHSWQEGVKQGVQGQGIPRAQLATVLNAALGRNVDEEAIEAGVRACATLGLVVEDGTAQRVLVHGRCTMASSGSGLPHEHAGSGLPSALPRPWRRTGGGVNKAFLTRVRSLLVGLVMRRPGITAQAVYEAIPVVSPGTLDNILRIMEVDGAITTRDVVCAPPSLFSQFSDITINNPLCRAPYDTQGTVTHLFPTPACVTLGCQP